MEKIIGTLNETAIHSALKSYFEPDTAFHEVEFLGYVADVKRDDKIYEIQSRSFYKLKKKLSAFLEAGCDVTVVYPMIRKKRLIHVDVETGEIVRTRMSPKSVKLPDMFCELVYLSDFLPLPGFSVAAVSLDAEVYKKCSSRGSKKGNADRLDCIPTEILESIAFSSADDYRALLPLSELETPFTASDLAAVIGCRVESARSMLLVLRKLGIVEKLDEREKKTRRAIFRVLPKEAE